MAKTIPLNSIQIFSSTQRSQTPIVPHWSQAGRKPSVTASLAV